MSTWYPHVTVATVIHKDGKYLLVEEESAGKKVYNQPAGHLEANETLIAAAQRETLEETAWSVKIYGFLGVSQYCSRDNGVSYVRHSFVAEPVAHIAERALDSDIIEAVWLPYEDILQLNDRLRSPMVLNDIERFRRNEWFNLSALSVLT